MLNGCGSFMECNWILFPNSLRPIDELKRLAAVFDAHMDEISSDSCNLKSDDVLAVVEDDLKRIGYSVERGKKAENLICMPVLFGEHGNSEKGFNVDAYHPGVNIALEVEAGRAVANNQFLKDLFEACMMNDAEYLCIAVRKQYSSGKIISRDYERVCTFIRTLYSSDRLTLPLKGVMVLGY